MILRQLPDDVSFVIRQLQKRTGGLSMGKKLAQNLMNLFFLALGIAFFVSSRTIAPGAVLGSGGDLLPKVLAIALLVLSVALTVKGFLGGDQELPEIPQKKSLLLCVALLALYVLLIGILGFSAASTLYLFCQILLFSGGKEKTWKTYLFYAGFALVFSVGIDVLFHKAFSMILPRGIFFK